MKKDKKPKFISAETLHREWMKDPEFQIARQIIGARIKNKMSQADLAKKAKTGQAVISRLEGMNAKPSISLLSRVAQALGTKIQITVP